MSITIGKLADTVFKHLAENGYEKSALKQNRLAFARVAQLHMEAGEVSFNSSIAESYIRNVWKRCEAGEISYGYFQNQNCIVRRLEEFHRTGTLCFAVDSKGSDFHLSNYFGDILHAFLADKQKDGRQAKVSWGVRKYFVWLMVNGYETLEAIEVGDLQRFLVYCSKSLKSRSLHDLKSSLKQFY